MNISRSDFSASSRIYTKKNLDRVAFPLGGIGSGMICIEGAGTFSQVSLRHRPQVFFEPVLFSAISVKGGETAAGSARVLAGPVPDWKLMFPWGKDFESSGDGSRNKIFGFPRFEEATFTGKFPFAKITLGEKGFPLGVEISAWNPFIPNDEDASSLPVAGVEYLFTNTSNSHVEAVFSFHAENFMASGPGESDGRVTRLDRGFVAGLSARSDKPSDEGYFAAWVDDQDACVNPAWFRGGWFDAMTMVWKSIAKAEIPDRPALDGAASRGGSIYVPVSLTPGAQKRIVLKWAWYVPFSDLQVCSEEKYRPWYATAFTDIEAVKTHWDSNYDQFRSRSLAFSEALHESSWPLEVIDAVAANLSILKSPTVLRQSDGRIWAWEGCHDESGSCPGTCTHVWNYAQALPHLFPKVERRLRETEFFESQNEAGHQNFRSSLPTGTGGDHSWHAAADGQLGGIIKAYRDWRISGDLNWLGRLWPRIKQSLDYCIETWDPNRNGLVIEPHHNTYDIEFWGEEGMVGSIYLGALAAAGEMGHALGENVDDYGGLLSRGRTAIMARVFNGEYFQQNIQWVGLRAKDPSIVTGLGSGYSPEALQLLQEEGPKYQYGAGCLSDGVIGAWMGWAAGLAPFMDQTAVGKHLDAVFRNNFRRDLWDHANPQRPTYATGHDGGLLICTWPRGGRLSLPLPYSEEIWTGIEYQVASHLISSGRVDDGLTLVRATRARYDGTARNPFNEFECGHWYARALASYALLQALSGARYDAVDRVLYLHPAVAGDFRSFLSTESGFGVVGVKEGKPFLDVKSGQIEVSRIDYIA